MACNNGGGYRNYDPPRSSTICLGIGGELLVVSVVVTECDPGGSDVTK